MSIYEAVREIRALVEEAKEEYEQIE